MTYPRSTLAPPGAPGVFHCISRCVHRAFLCGEDSYTGKSFEHRRQWGQDRLRALGQIFAMLIWGFAVMSNHLHMVVQTLPEVASSWSDLEVAERWVRLFPRPDQAPELRAAVLSGHTDWIARLRARLADLSWFMRVLSEPIERRANIEDICKGRFWGRFLLLQNLHSTHPCASAGFCSCKTCIPHLHVRQGPLQGQAWLDDSAVIAAMAYVDLNPVGADRCDTLEASHHTSARRHLTEIEAEPTKAWHALAPVLGIRSLSVLRMSQAENLGLVDCTGRQISAGKRGAIAGAAPNVTTLSEKCRCGA